MKRSLIAASVLSAVFMSAGAFAAEYDSGVLNINGKVVGTTCQFVDTNTAEIRLNEIGADKLSAVSPGTIYDAVTNQTQVPLKIKCQPNVTPRITFVSTQFDSNNFTLNNGSAKGVGFAVYYGNTDSQIDPQTGVTLEPNKDGVYDLTFLARYARLAGDVEKGEVSSTLTLTVVTD
ncbi:fimbrial protein YehD [Salmonella enterica]|uniref:Fimbrial protein YehD n=1 Tax=Salmonella enterica TaxID=28901 RepID=A0A5U1Q5B3_SALER|nr:fimbrial protein YehD [Salmonella enterica]EBL3323144.1 fimbrial protein YehD [Salmonella enterica subsp. enterica]ECC1652310.1 fimbrial protein YehD [Salmonella enterica subsp. arizonae]EDR3672958.1 fimbrial protein YehD [Salmonella enterica subsp. arizonae serovar 40:z4,z24:]EEE2581961.1 fimbrial protein YehD [Salmonella enterica subsp. arizonae serovar 56:z4,z23:-]PVL56238.1 fimbrial chaperone protein [Salmonella enterica subsp. arizonae serovar 51:g,z51:-]HBJ6281391.1 fimbrial protein 